jgi:putative ABC transport system permease protein
MDTELRFHVESQIREYMNQGMTPEQAERRARSEFGTVELAKDEIRDVMPWYWLDHLWRDVRLAVLSLRKAPGLALAVIVTLALGIGANTAIFGIVYAVLLKPLPYADPDRIYSADIVIPERRDLASLPLEIQEYLAWRKAPTAFSSMATLTPARWNLAGDGEPERVGGARISASFFDLLGTPLQHGRGFAPDEEQPGRDAIVVISDGLWRRRYGADPSLVGKSIRLNGRNHIVVGIASPSLLVPTGTLLHPLLAFASRIDVWKPIAPTKADLESHSSDYGLLLRLKAGETVEHGRQQLQALLMSYLREILPSLNIDVKVRLSPIREVYTGRTRFRLLFLLGASGLLLLAACTNIANLLLARAAGRAGELGMRIALGASRARIVSLMLAECTLLSAIGGTAGLYLAKAGTTLLAAYVPEDVRLLADSHLSLPVSLFALAMSLITGLACGIIPALQAFPKRAFGGLQGGVRTAFSGRLAVRSRQILVGVEMALATALLASAGLLLHSFAKVIRAQRGYQVDHVLAVELAPAGQRFASVAQRAAFYRDLTTSIRGLPGALAAGLISDLPATGDGGSHQTLFLESDTDDVAVVMQRPGGLVRSVTPGYFAASETALRAGRFLQDQESVPVALVSQAVAKRLWPGEEVTRVLGHRFRCGGVTGPLITVVGIVDDVRTGALDRELPPQIYMPYEQRPNSGMTVVVRTAQESVALAAAVRAEIRKMDPNLPIPTVRTMREILSESVAQRHFQMLLTSLFAGLSLLLGAVGVYGMVSYTVACRVRDIGLRLALGAVRRDVMRWVLAFGLRPVVIGMAIGLAGALAIAEALRSLLYEVAPADPLSFGGVAGVLLIVSALACYLPARRAANLDPITALRHE